MKLEVSNREGHRVGVTEFKNTRDLPKINRRATIERKYHFSVLESIDLECRV